MITQITILHPRASDNSFPLVFPKVACIKKKRIFKAKISIKENMKTIPNILEEEHYFKSFFIWLSWLSYSLDRENTRHDQIGALLPED